jgi:hypothetical protein
VKKSFVPGTISTPAVPASRHFSESRAWRNGEQFTYPQEVNSMARKYVSNIRAMALFVAALIPCGLALAQDTQAPAPAAGGPTVLEQLQAQYKMVKMGTDSNGPTVLEEGTILAIQKGGVLGVPSGSPKPCPAKYENGTLKPPSGLCVQGRKQGGLHGFSAITSHIPGGGNANAPNTSDTRFFNKGEKVYSASINVDVKDEKIAFNVVACDTCNQTNPPTYYKAEVDFQFATGFLEKGDVSKIEDTIGEVFQVDNSAQDAGQQGQQPAQADQQQPAAPPTPPQPVSIQIGQTIDQVVAALGQPDKTVNLGAKQIYVYKDLKVTFLNGKVSDVQ